MIHISTIYNKIKNCLTNQNVLIMLYLSLIMIIYTGIFISEDVIILQNMEMSKCKMEKMECEIIKNYCENEFYNNYDKLDNCIRNNISLLYILTKKILIILFDIIILITLLLLLIIIYIIISWIHTNIDIIMNNDNIRNIENV
jgi:hypothetical protein